MDQNNPSMLWWSRLNTLFAGASAGVLTAVFTSPLDVTRTRLAVQNTVHPSGPLYSGLTGTLTRIWKEEGVKGFYRGFGPAVMVIPLFWSVYFTSYEYVKKSIGARYYNDLSHPSLHIASAAIAGSFTDVITNPLWVVRTRMQTQHMGLPAMSPILYRNTFDALRRIRKEEGILSWYRGLSASLLGVTHVMVQFPIYERLKIALPAWGGHNKPTWTDLIVASAGSKLVATSATYPHEVLRARLQFSGRYRNLFDCLFVTVREEGVSALYKGLTVNILKTTPACALTFVTYELILDLVSHQPNRPPHEDSDDDGLRGD